MEAQSRVMWDFLRLSYQRGLMDDLMALGDLMDPDMDFVDVLESFEDAVMAMDLNPLSDLWQEQIQPMIRSMTKEESMDALRAVLQALKPILVKLTRGRGQADLLEKVQTFVALKPRLMVLLRDLSPLAALPVQRFVRDDAGTVLGRALNAVSGAIVKSHARDPELVERIFRDLFRTLDTAQFGRAMEIVMGGVLDQRPKVVRWTFGAVFARLKKRFAHA
ncbi:MAG TPA: hypothetical protein PLB81_09070 [Deltaproteobacteria bacterium]|nr:hypothetical protein [Deltaproteobacteria bacterium]